MELTDLIDKFRERCGGLDDIKAKALLEDLRACGVQGGPNLRDAYDAWRARWRKHYAPKAAEFAEDFYAGRDVAPLPPKTVLPDPIEWANHILLETAEGQLARQQSVVASIYEWAKQNPGKMCNETIIREHAEAGERVRALSEKYGAAIKSRERRFNAWWDREAGRLRSAAG